MLNLPDEGVNERLTIYTYIESRSKFLETDQAEVENLSVKTLLWVDEKANVEEGRIKEEVKIVKSITLLMTRIDAQKRRNE
jgi:hypothetical protein